MCSGVSRLTRIAGFVAIRPSSTAAFKHITKRPHRVVDGLWAPLAGVHRLGLLFYPSAHVLDAKPPERDRRERRQQPLAPVDLIATPGRGLQVGLASRQPPLPVLAEGHARVAHLAALHLLNQPPLCIPRRALAREATSRHLHAATPARLEVPAVPLAVE
jgi:hypothetical protein